MVFISFIKMANKMSIVLFVVCTSFINIMGDDISFAWNGFLGKNLSMEGAAKITNNNLLQLTNISTTNQIGHAFFPVPLSFSEISNFSTTFVFAIVPKEVESGNGFVFAISPSPSIPDAEPRQFLGLFNMSNHGSKSNQIFAVEFDTIQNPEFEDIENEHVGIDANSLISLNSSSAGYFAGNRFENLRLDSGKAMQVWIDYVKNRNELNVTMAPLGVPLPIRPLLSININLSSIVAEQSYFGFSAATGTILCFHYVLGWSLAINRQSEPLDLSLLPTLPVRRSKNKPNGWKIGVGVLSVFLAIAIVSSSFCGFNVWRKNKRKFEVLESWEHEIGAHRISYKELCKATKGFIDEQVIGSGGFGKVYKGVLPGCGTQVAVKRVCHNSEQIMEQFLAEIRSIGRIRHEKLVKLIGYCRLRGELLLIYELLDGSLDEFLYGNSKKVILTWRQRFEISKDVAAGLLFLHGEWESIVIHRDMKGSNILLDKHLSAKVGDFGLCRLIEHGKDPKTTKIAGTIGYMAPELHTTGTATKASDVYGFGSFLLEVVCGRRPFDPNDAQQRYWLVSWVLECLKEGCLVDAVDKKLRSSIKRQKEREEIELVMKIGLLCMQHVDTNRPTMDEVVKLLEGDLSLPDVFDSGDFRGRISSTFAAATVSPVNVVLTSSSLESVSVLYTGR